MQQIDAQRLRLFLITSAEIRAVSVTGAAAAVRESITSYLSTKIQNPPTNLFELTLYDHESGLLTTETIVTSTTRIWACRLQDPDETVSARTWSLELIVAEGGNRITFASRLSCFSRNLDFDVEPAVPRVFKDLVSKRIVYGDGSRLSISPIDVSDDDEVDWLVTLIHNPKRTRDLIVIACDEHGNSMINPDAVSSRICLVAHLVRIYPKASFKLSSRVGKHLSVFDFGARIYKPTQNIESDDPFRHTLYTKNRLAGLAPNRLYTEIAKSAFRTSIESGLREPAIPSFAQIRSASSALRLADIKNRGEDANSTTLLEGQLHAAVEAKIAAEAQTREAMDVAIQEEEVRKSAEQERDQERARSMALAARVRSLEARQDGTAAAAAFPTDYEDIPVWLMTEFTGRIKLHSRALRALKDAQYENIDLVCELIELLAIEFVNSKRGVQGAWEKFEAGIERRGVQFSRSISESRAGEQGDEYFVRIRSRKEILQWHLKKGTSRDPARDLRIYFLWDEEDEELVIGYLPGHLDNRLT